MHQIGLSYIQQQKKWHKINKIVNFIQYVLLLTHAVVNFIIQIKESHQSFDSVRSKKNFIIYGLIIEHYYQGVNEILWTMEFTDVNSKIDVIFCIW